MNKSNKKQNVSNIPAPSNSVLNIDDKPVSDDTRPFTQKNMSRGAFKPNKGSK